VGTTPEGVASHIHLQRRDKRLLRNIDLAVLPHAFLAFLLLVQQLAIARGVAAVAFGGDVLAEGACGLARDDFAADGSTNLKTRLLAQPLVKLIQLMAATAMSNFPSSIVAVDVETTGLHSNDRIVSLGAWRVNSADFSKDALSASSLHIVADPGKKSHPRAEEVHGYSDWTLRHQQPFAENAEAVREFLSNGSVVIAHNAGFDFGFIEREYQALGQVPPKCSRYCTMNAYRHSGLAGRASLKAICQNIGIERVGDTHGALEDAWMAMMVYLWLNQAPSKFIQPFTAILEKGIPTRPSNFREPPPQPDGPLPRRRKAQAIEINTATSVRVDSVAKNALFKEVRPTAILLLEVARADERVATEENEIIATLIRSACDRLGLPEDEEAERELLAELFDTKLSQNLLTRAARGVCENPIARAEFPKWAASMAIADGGFSVSEREAFDRVKAAINRVLSKSG
jgi:DNA polymerase-3 subunit epsilon